jgi:hypothetical protein
VVQGSGSQGFFFGFVEYCTIAHVKEAPVANYLELSSGLHQWTISFIRASHDCEVDVFTSFFNLLYSLTLR